VFNGFHALKMHHQFLFTVIIGFAIVAFWWGVWGFLDDYFLPRHKCLWLRYTMAILIALIILLASNFLVQGLL